MNSNARERRELLPGEAVDVFAGRDLQVGQTTPGENLASTCKPVRWSL